MARVREQQRESYHRRQLSTLSVSQVSAPNVMSRVRAASWHNSLLRLGIPLPFFVVHDLGLLLSERVAIATDDPPTPQIEAYRALLVELQSSALAQLGAAGRARTDLTAVILARVLREIYQRWDRRRQWVGAVELSLDPGRYRGEIEIVGDHSLAVSLLEHLVNCRLYLLTAVEQIDLDTVKLLGMFSDQSPLDLADLLNVFSSSEANGVVNFSMDLLPAILETSRQSGIQTFSFDGYASIERHGSIDSMMLTEFAYDDEVFEQKLVDNELFYFAHEKQLSDTKHVNYLLVDSSASMRGEREVFARGLALTLSKSLVLQGQEVWLRFFDSRLYEPMRMDRGSAAVPYLLCFRSERGRNYARVFRQLLGEIRRQRRADGRAVTLYLITHGQCHIGTDVVSDLSAIASIYGVFILPSSDLHLDYLPLLRRYQIVDADALGSRSRSIDRALEIVDDATTPASVADAPASGETPASV